MVVFDLLLFTAASARMGFLVIINMHFLFQFSSNLEKAFPVYVLKS